MTESLPRPQSSAPPRATFDPSRFAEVDATNTKTSEYLIPAVKQLPGLIHFYAGVSPDGSMLQVSVWDSVEHSAQLNHLKEMVVVARGEMEAIGVTFTPIVNYPSRAGPSDLIQQSGIAMQAIHARSSRTRAWRRDLTSEAAPICQRTFVTSP